jgi:isoquinoline 1-oxidoreductase alpha subunit
MIKLTVNGKTHDLDVEDDTPLLWVIRDEVGLTGTKFGCGVGGCGPGKGLGQ